jgi:hypothetical protein
LKAHRIPAGKTHCTGVSGKAGPVLKGRKDGSKAIETFVFYYST